MYGTYVKKQRELENCSKARDASWVLTDRRRAALLHFELSVALGDRFSEPEFALCLDDLLH